MAKPQLPQREATGTEALGQTTTKSEVKRDGLWQKTKDVLWNRRSTAARVGIVVAAVDATILIGWALWPSTAAVAMSSSGTALTGGTAGSAMVVGDGFISNAMETCKTAYDAYEKLSTAVECVDVLVGAATERGGGSGSDPTSGKGKPPQTAMGAGIGGCGS
jgi:hypothetical protein